MPTWARLFFAVCIGAVVAVAKHFLGYEFVSCFLLATIAFFSVGIWEHVTGAKKKWAAED